MISTESTRRRFSPLCSCPLKSRTVSTRPDGSSRVVSPTTMAQLHSVDPAFDGWNRMYPSHVLILADPMPALCSLLKVARLDLTPAKNRSKHLARRPLPAMPTGPIPTVFLVPPGREAPASTGEPSSVPSG
jgi:hypothetical protein